MKLHQMIYCSTLCLLGLLGSTLLTSPVAAQVFGPGPSDPALFTEVINMPADMASYPSNTFLGGIPGGTIQVNIENGGSIGNQVHAFVDSEVNISGGSIGVNFETDGEVNITGGSVGRNFHALAGSQVDISGGTIASEFAGFAGSEIRIRGGRFGIGFLNASPLSDVEIFGGEFQFNGNDITDGSSIAQPGVFSGTLADGSVFIEAGSITGPTLTASSLPQVSLVPIVIDSPLSSGPQGLRSGQTLTVREGGELADSFQSVNAVLNVEGGLVGSELAVVGSELNISGGVVGNGNGFYDGSVVNISGGVVGNGTGFYAGSEVTISGGTVGDFARAFGGIVNITGGTVGDGFIIGNSVVNISGGSVGDDIRISGGAAVINISGGTVGANFHSGTTGNTNHPDEFNISGGTFGDGLFLRGEANVTGGTFEGIVVSGEVTVSGGTFTGGLRVYPSGQLTFIGTYFELNGVPVNSDAGPGGVVITERNRTLTGFLADGTLLSFNLANVDGLLVVQDLNAGVLGDCDLNGEVNFLDIAPFIETLTSNTYLVQADCNQDGAVNFLDIAHFIAILAAQ